MSGHQTMEVLEIRPTKRRRSRKSEKKRVTVAQTYKWSHVIPVMRCFNNLQVMKMT